MIKQEHIDFNLIKSEPIDGDFSTSDIVSELLGTVPNTLTSNDQHEPMDQDDLSHVVIAPSLTQETTLGRTSWTATVTNTISNTNLQPSNNVNRLGDASQITTTTPTVKILGIHQEDGQPTKLIHVQQSTAVSINKQIYITSSAAASTSPSKVIAITGGNVSGRLVQSIGGPPRFQIMPGPTKIGSQTTLKTIAPRFTTSTPTGPRPSVPGAQIQIISPAPRDGTQTNENTSQTGSTNTTRQQPARVLIQAVPTGHHGTQQLRAIAPNLGGLPPGAAIQFPVGTIIKDGVVYVPQPQVQPGGLQLSAVHINPTSGNMATQQVNGVQEPLSPSRQRKPCNCTKSQCLKLYCDCFANGEFCSNCNCNNCSNNIEHDNERSKAIKACLERNPHAFHPKIGKGKGETERRHNKGCHCKRSGCLKNYCECYEAKILCTNICKCTGCKNFEESPERKTLMHLADAAEVRVQQQNAAKTKLESQMEDLPSRAPILAHAGERLPFSFVTRDVVEATCRCLLLQATGAEKTNKSHSETQKLILEEFGSCLLKIIHTANKRTAC